MSHARSPMLFSCLMCLLALLLSGGCQKQGGFFEQVNEPTEDVPEVAAVAAPPQPQGFSELEWKLVERNRALAENPELVEVENHTQAKDPLTAVTQSYFSGTSKLNATAIEYNAKLQSFIDAEGAQEPKPPSFEHLNQQMQQNSNMVKGLKPWQAYAYDELTGKVTILEDRAEKKRLYEERGLKYED